MNSILQKYIDELNQGRSFGEDDAGQVLDALIESTDEAALAAVFDAWNRKGIEEHEIYAFAKIMRERCVRVNSRHQTVVDIVGTGGSRVKTFNVSTAAAFVVAGKDVPVAKHGNKAATSNSGSADVLSTLGINHSAGPAVAENCLNEIGICFMFAPNHHRLSPTLARVRRGLGYPTIFNCIGPLCNPAYSQHQLIGVWDKALLPKMAGALAKLGTKKSWVVHGEDGLDEISLGGRTFVAEVEDNKVSYFDVQPADLFCGRSALEALKVNSAAESAEIILGVLDGNLNDSAAESIIIANAMAALYLAGRAEKGDGFHDARDLALDSIRSGRARNKLRMLAEATKA